MLETRLINLMKKIDESYVFFDTVLTDTKKANRHSSAVFILMWKIAGRGRQ